MAYPDCVIVFGVAVNTKVSLTPVLAAIVTQVTVV